MAVVRTMKQQQLVAQRRWHESQQQQQHRSGASSSTANLATPCTSRCTGGQTSSTATSVVPHACTGWGDGWVGHPLDPVGCVFDTLADASLIPDDQTSRTPSYFGKDEVIFLNLKKSRVMVSCYVSFRSLSLNFSCKICYLYRSH